MMDGKEREKVNYGGKIILPPSALAKLASLNIQYPMLFELVNEDHERRTHAGVLEFVAQEGHVYLPHWMMQTLLVEPGDIIQVKNASLPLGTYVKLQPQSVDFLDISDPKAVLENELRTFSTLTEGDIIQISYNRKIYEILVVEVKPSTRGAISIVETDLSVDFAPPVGYKEPAPAPKIPAMAKTMNIDQSVSSPPLGFTAFKGSGQRLGGNLAQSRSPTPSVSSSVSNTDIKSNLMSSDEKASAKPDAENIAPAPLNLPFGKLYFGYEIKPFQNEVEAPVDSVESKFKGEGQTLRPKRGQSRTASPAPSNSSLASSSSRAQRKDGK
ncbi:uncharacterized protein VTP21DRAFT_7174 [Calcarisporiella thermophila]|uniref:uncharacterized protein n=1 Tax=Calcarisporiella thermophila TaxID=911321 RepID=UPI0037438BD2